MVTLAIQTRLSGVVDLSDPAEAKVVGTNAQELTGDWAGYRERGSAASVTGPVGKAPTQESGEQLFALCPYVQGIVTLSALVPYCRILVVFPQRLRPGADYVRYKMTDDSGHSKTIQIP